MPGAQQRHARRFAGDGRAHFIRAGVRPEILYYVSPAARSSLCLFCQERPADSDEHVIPQEVSLRIREVSPLTPDHGGPVARKPGAVRFHTNRLIDLVVRAVCRTCNEGFFNELQAAARPFFHPAIAGEAVELSTELKRAVAAWAYKTALLIPLTATPRKDWAAVVGTLCSDFYRAARPAI